MRTFGITYLLAKENNTNYPMFKWSVTPISNRNDGITTTYLFRTKKEAQKTISRKKHELIKLNNL